MITPTSLADYQQWIRNSTLYTRGLMYTLPTLAAESGEALNVLIKVMRGDPDSHTITGSDLAPEARATLVDELSDTLFGLTATLNELGMSLDELASINIRKIEERIENGTHYRSL